jgi:hypothetical protein
MLRIHGIEDADPSKAAEKEWERTRKRKNSNSNTYVRRPPSLHHHPLPPSTHLPLPPPAFPPSPPPPSPPQRDHLAEELPKLLLASKYVIVSGYLAEEECERILQRRK